MTACFPLDARDRIEEAVASAGVGELMSRFRRLSESDVQRKTSAFDVVTAADEAAEQAIGAFLATAFPGAIMIGEESAGRDPALVELILGCPGALPNSGTDPRAAVEERIARGVGRIALPVTAFLPDIETTLGRFGEEIIKPYANA